MAKAINGLLGRTLGHSFSVDIHRELGNPEYRLIELEPELLDAFFSSNEIKALNVTIPYKQSVMPYCATLSEEAAAIGSVNTIVRASTVHLAGVQHPGVFLSHAEHSDILNECYRSTSPLKASGTLYGHNTDAYGFAFMAGRAGISFAGKKVLILGSGGTSLTAQFVAKRAGSRSIVVATRTRKCASTPVVNTPAKQWQGSPSSDANRGSVAGINEPASFGQTSTFIAYESLDEHFDADILVNTTPLGMYPKDSGRSVVDLASFPRLAGVLDVVYNPLRTALLLQAEERGIPHEGGLSMLVAQAKAAEELFLGHAIPNTEIERILELLRIEKENIVLIGMPGSGKTVVGQALGMLTGRAVVDLDAESVNAADMSIPELFERQGEETFRKLESAQAAKWGAQNGLILVTGGGIVTRPCNFEHLRQNGRVYHLSRATSLLQREGRPLSIGTDLERMYEERLPLYERFRNVQIENSDTPESAARRIWSDFCEHTGY